MATPRSDGEGATPAAAETERGGEAARKRILLVEDNEDNRTVYRMILEHGGYQVIEARTGTEALAFAGEERPHLILMDISIPQIDGWEVTRRLKASEETRHIPVVALTAHALAADRAQAAAVGCDGYLTKPVAPRKVLAEVESRLGGSGPAGGAEPPQAPESHPRCSA